MNESQHHGILGQKWGKRNGPPYPLSGSNHSSSEKKAGWRKSINDKSTAKTTDGSPSAKMRKHYGVEAKRLYKSAVADRKHGRFATIGEQRKRYTDNKLIKQIRNDERWKQNKDKLNKTKYDGPDEDYNPYEDSKVIDLTTKNFKKDLGRKPDLNDRRDKKMLEYYEESAVEKLGLNKKAEKVNKAPLWEKAYDEYVEQGHAIIDDYLGKYKNKKIDNGPYAQKYSDYVYHIVSSMD